MDGAGRDPSEEPTPRWAARVVEALQPVRMRADRLGSTSIFEDFRWPELQVVAGLFETIEVKRGERLTVQGRPDERLWIVVSGEALVSADARPLRVIGPGEAAGVAGMLYSIASPETTISLGVMRTLAVGPAEFEELVKDDRIRRRLTALAGDQLRSRRLAKLR